jgi:hypothetical protein
MTAIVNCATALGALVYGAEELPFASPHLWTGCRRTWRIVEKEPDYQLVAFVYQEPAEFIEP